MDFSAGALFSSLVVSSVGFGFFIYGKKNARGPQLLAGVAMMIYPYFVSGPAAMLGIACGLLLALHGALRAGF